MDPDRVELIRQLCTQAGMIMEDASSSALLIADVTDEGIRSTVTDLMVASERIKALVEAAAALAP
jgi:hypothetical protein